MTTDEKAPKPADKVSKKAVKKEPKAKVDPAIAIANKLAAGKKAFNEAHAKLKASMAALNQAVANRKGTPEKELETLAIATGILGNALTCTDLVPEVLSGK